MGFEPTTGGSLRVSAPTDHHGSADPSIIITAGARRASWLRHDPLFCALWLAALNIILAFERWCFDYFYLFYFFQVASF